MEIGDGVGAGGGVDPQGDGGGEPGAAKDAPEVSEELVWKNRALDAEREVEELRMRLSETESQLEQARGALEMARREHELEVQLHRAGVVDAETARALIGPRVEAGEGVASVVAELRRTKPFLFGEGYGARGSIGGVSGGGIDPAEMAAEQARQSGDRRALLKYLRLRRGVC